MDFRRLGRKVVRILCVYWNASCGVRWCPVTIACMAKMADFSRSNRTPPADAGRYQRPVTPEAAGSSPVHPAGIIRFLGRPLTRRIQLSTVYLLDCTTTEGRRPHGIDRRSRNPGGA